MIKFCDNKQVKTEIKKAMLDAGIKQKELCEKLEMTPQNYCGIVNKKQLSFNDVQKILEAMDCELYFEIRQKKENEK